VAKSEVCPRTAELGWSGWFCTEFNHTFKHTYRFFFAFALAVRSLAADLDAFVAISFRRSGESRAFRDFAPFFPIAEK
jgi:hypothetical protein